MAHKDALQHLSKKVNKTRANTIKIKNIKMQF